jgi:hypothetical protein
MKIILPILPKVCYLLDLERFQSSVRSKKASYLSYLSYLTFFVHFSFKNRVDKIVILSTPHTPCTKNNFNRKSGFLGKINTVGKMIYLSYLSPKMLIMNDKMPV